MAAVRKTVLGEREQVLYWRLVTAFPDRVVLAQVALSQVLGIEKGAKQRQVLFNRFRQLTADFVVCRRNFEPVAVIELDGLSHDRPHRQAADQRKTLAAESAGLVLVRINAAALPDEVELRRPVQDTRGDGQPRNRNASVQ
jgi:very-short-patch-repair endonuclease